MNGVTSKLNMLLYANDLALIADTEEDLQKLLDALSKWCKGNEMSINIDKTKVVHFRNPAKSHTAFSFSCGNQTVDVTTSYRYLGLTIGEHLNYNVTAKALAAAASRALGLVISKFKSAGGLPYSLFSELYVSIVWSTISYGVCIWGQRNTRVLMPFRTVYADFF